MMSNLEQSDESLVERVKNGDESAFEIIYDRYWKKLFNYGYQRSGKREVVEGMVQEVFIDFWAKRKELNIHTSLASYFFTAIKYKVINHHKAQSVREKFASAEKSKGEKNVSHVEERVFYKDLKSCIKKVVTHFPTQRKRVYELRFNGGLSYNEIAANMEISVSTVEKHMIKALKEIREQLTKYSFSFLVLTGNLILF
ncbi:RNA polymerase sigma factor [Rhodonellum sp.]|uniref:RNA polymerase sigma factor n=1 Tax=Rhodonellum sp. TaxID=2231180 RepID=UPI0027215B36|nr:RNA polymerase sigma-70 factor [Rhodonellum sp.]MDO9551100.1 RNA polymerase sigma-70 factor [Rhodonellum sp.]